MVKMFKHDKTKLVPDDKVQGQIKNGWKLEQGETQSASAVVKPVQQDTVDTPAVEESASEQGEEDEA